VRACFPHHPWQVGEFITASYGLPRFPQHFLLRILRSLFPGERIEFNDRKSHGIVTKRPEASKLMEIDLYLPALKLGFECQVCLLVFYNRHITNQTKPNQTKPNQTKPNQTKPNQTIAKTKTKAKTKAKKTKIKNYFQDIYHYFHHLCGTATLAAYP
jgi:hypothetical protein